MLCTGNPVSLEKNFWKGTGSIPIRVNSPSRGGLIVWASDQQIIDKQDEILGPGWDLAIKWDTKLD